MKTIVVTFDLDNEEVNNVRVTATGEKPGLGMSKSISSNIKEQILAKREADKVRDLEQLLDKRKTLGITETKPLEETNDIVIIKVLEPLGEKYQYPNATFEIDTPDEWLGELEPEHFYIASHPEGNKKLFLSVIEISKEDAYRLNKYYYEITKTWQTS